MFHGQNNAQVDTTVMSLLSLNQRMADEADKAVLATLKDGRFGDMSLWAQLECGAWQMRMPAIDVVDTVTPRKNERWGMTIEVRGLDSVLIVQQQGEWNIMTGELPEAVEEGITAMHHGQSTSLLAPWYAAYGAYGNADVPPYENVLMIVTLE